MYQVAGRDTDISFLEAAMDNLDKIESNLKAG
jgi:hypothetical protein